METKPSLLSLHQVLQPPTKKAFGGKFEYVSRAPAWHVSFSRNGLWLAVAVGAPDCCVRVYERTEGEKDGTACDDSSYVLRHTLEDLHSRTVRYCAFAPIVSNLALATASFDGTVGVWFSQNEDRNDFECLAQLEGHESECKCVVWNATSTLLATSGRDKSVWIWESALPGEIGKSDGDFECLAVLTGHEGDVKTITFAPSHGQFGDADDILISAGYDNLVKVWAEDDGEWYCVHSLEEEKHTVWSIAVAPGGLRFLTGCADGSIGIYKVYTAQELRTGNEGGSQVKKRIQCVGRLPRAHITEGLLGVAYASARAGHGRFASCGPDGSLQVYREAMESTSEKPLFSLECQNSSAGGTIEYNCVAWHPLDGSMLATANHDGKVEIWRYGR